MEKKLKMNRPLKKKKSRTWAEAITEALARSSTKVLGVQEIHEKIVLYKLKDVRMTKQDEKVLKTMLAQSMNSENCPFYKVRDRPGSYALKDPNMYRAADDDGSDVEIIDLNEDSNGSGNSLKKRSKQKGSPSVIITEPKSLDKKKLISTKALSSTKRSNSFTGEALREAQLLSRRRTSTPSLSHSHLRTVPRSRSIHALQKTHSNPGFNTRRSQMILDLETPSSTLTNTRLKSIINLAIFTMLPTSYQYQLIQLLPEVDRVLDENGVPRMTTTALNNEFFSQALQDWSTQLSEGEFTRETQARIMQEIAKERSKIAPWKEKFFEEYYGQKQELKRTRSRSHDATANLADLSYEAQLLKFHHLAAVVDGNTEKDEDEENEADGVIMVESESETDQDPDYVDNIPLAERFPSKDSSKPINRRKISKPFKRTILNPPGGYSRNTAMIHRRGVIQSSSTPIFPQFGAAGMPKFKSSSSTIRSHPAFQVRDEAYRSDSEASDTGELSDSNSFHQHDESDEDDDGESSDGMMNLGDDNLMDVDDDSDSDDRENSTTDHSYTKNDPKASRRPSGSREWRRPSLSKAISLFTTERTKSDSSSQSRTLVLRPKENTSESFQSLAGGGSSSNTSPEAPISKQFIEDQPIFEKILRDSEQEKSKDERVGVIFRPGLQPAVNTCYGESIIPRISATSGLLSSPITPTTVCTSTTPASQQAKNDKNMLPTKCHTSENATTLKSRKKFSECTGSIVSSATTTRTTRSSQTMKGTALTAVAKLQPSTYPIEPKSTTDVNKKDESTIDTFGLPQNFWHSSSSSESKTLGSSSILGNKLPVVPSLKSENQRRSPVLGSPRAGTSGIKRAQASTSLSPVKRTRTLAEIKAQMKAKRAAAASGSPVRNAKPGATLQPTATKPPVKIAQPVFCPNSTRILPTSPVEKEPVAAIDDPCSPVLTGMIPENIAAQEPADSLKTDAESGIKDIDISAAEKEGSSTKNVPGKIILKIKSQEGKKYSVKVDTQKSLKNKNSDSDDGDIVRKTRRLSQVISSSGESSDDFDGMKESGICGGKHKENYSMLSQLALPGSYSSKSSVVDHHSLLKRTQKSPVFGEPAFEGLGDMPKSVAPLSNASTPANEVTKSQPFMSDKPVIGFQDIPSCTTLSSSSNMSTFVKPSPTISVAAEGQKYRSIGKGKSLVQMQQLARTNRITSDESEQADTDTEDDSTASMTSSAEDDPGHAVQDLTTENNRLQLRARNQPSKSGKKLENGTTNGKKASLRKDYFDCEDSYSSSSSDDKPIITECICSCKRLVLCKGCGAYTHEECLSSTKLCSLCV